MPASNPDPNLRQRDRELSHGVSPKPSLMEILQNNILIVAIVVAVGSGTTIFGITNYYYEQQKKNVEAEHQIQLKQISLQHSAEVEKLNNRMTSIDRRLGDQKYLDIQSFFKAKPITNSLSFVYIPGAEIFVPDYRDRWSYSKTTEGALIKEMTGRDLSGDSLWELFARVPIYIWRGNEEFNLEGVELKKLFPYISVQVTPLSIIPDIAGAMAKIASSDLSEPVMLPATESPEGGAKSKDQISESSGAENIRHFVNNLQSDVIGVFFLGQLEAVSSMATDPHVTFSLRNIQKVGPVLYAQIVLKFDDLVVNGVKTSKLFLVREYYVISTNNDVVLLETNALSRVPSFTGGYFDDINQWLAGFYLAEK